MSRRASRSCRPLDRVGSDRARDVRHCRTLSSFERHLPCERILGGEPTDCSARILSGAAPCPVNAVGRLHHCQRDLLSAKVRRLERAHPCSSDVDDIDWNGSRPGRSRTRWRRWRRGTSTATDEGHQNEHDDERGQRAPRAADHERMARVSAKQRRSSGQLCRTRARRTLAA